MAFTFQFRTYHFSPSLLPDSRLQTEARLHDAACRGRVGDKGPAAPPGAWTRERVCEPEDQDPRGPRSGAQVSQDCLSPLFLGSSSPSWSSTEGSPEAQSSAS